MKDTLGVPVSTTMCFRFLHHHEEEGFWHGNYTSNRRSNDVRSVIVSFLPVPLIRTASRDVVIAVPYSSSRSSAGRYMKLVVSLQLSRHLFVSPRRSAFSFLPCNHSQHGPFNRRHFTVPFPQARRHQWPCQSAAFVTFQQPRLKAEWYRQSRPDSSQRPCQS